MDKIRLYVDDLRDCPEGYVVARNVEVAIQYLEKGNIEVLSLDHDLGEHPITKELLPTGYDLVKYMCENGLYADKIYIHTDNGVGRENMYKTLLGAQRRGFLPDFVEVYHYSITINRYTGG